MWVRVTTIEGSADQFDEGMQVIRENVLPAARQMDGFRGVLSVATSDRRKGLTLTFWETEQALTASEEAANLLREQAASAGGGTIANVERYEIVVDERG